MGLHFQYDLYSPAAEAESVCKTSETVSITEVTMRVLYGNLSFTQAYKTIPLGL